MAKSQEHRDYTEKYVKIHFWSFVYVTANSFPLYLVLYFSPYALIPVYFPQFVISDLYWTGFLCFHWYFVKESLGYFLSSNPFLSAPTQTTRLVRHLLVSRTMTPSLPLLIHLLSPTSFGYNIPHTCSSSPVVLFAPPPFLRFCHFGVRRESPSQRALSFDSSTSVGILRLSPTSCFLIGATASTTHLLQALPFARSLQFGLPAFLHAIKCRCRPDIGVKSTPGVCRSFLEVTPRAAGGRFLHAPYIIFIVSLPPFAETLAPFPRPSEPLGRHMNLYWQRFRSGSSSVVSVAHATACPSDNSGKRAIAPARRGDDATVPRRRSTWPNLEQDHNV